jgi:hypothetical protein
LVFVAAVAFLAVVSLTAMIKHGSRGGKSMDGTEAHALLDKGNFWVLVWNTPWWGPGGGAYGGAGEWPGGSGVEYIYTSNNWFGCLKDGSIRVIGEMSYYGPTEWDPIEPTANQILRSDESNWSLRPSKVNTVGDLDTYGKSDDGKDKEGGIPCEFEFHGMCWSAPGHDNWVVAECWLKNTSSSIIKDCYISLASDFDVGGSLDYIDDLVGYEGNDASDTWMNPTVAGQPWTTQSPDGVPDENDAVNFSSLSAAKPLVYGDGTMGMPRMMPYMYDSGGEARTTPGYIGLRTMGWMADPPEDNLIEVSSQHSWDIMNDPGSDAYQYGYMIDVGTFEEINTAYDWRVDPCFGPFEMDPNDEIHYWEGIVMGSDLNDLRKNADQLYADFIGPDGIPGTSDDWTVVAPPPSPRLVGVRGDNRVTLRFNPAYAIGKNTETEPDPRTGNVDFDGYIVWRSDVGYDSGWVPILWVDKQTTAEHRYYPWGWRVTGGSASKNERIPDGSGAFTEPNLTATPAVTYESLNTSFPTPTRQGGNARVRKVNGYYELVDGVDASGEPTGDLANGTRYYYAVVAYDFGSDDPDFTTQPAMGGRNSNALAVIPLPVTAGTLDNVVVVPNPYKGSADWEEWTGSGARLSRIYFMNLPARCTIRIYTVAGDLVRTLEHNDVASGAEPWDLTGASGVQIASGIYFYHLDAPGIGEKIGKFAVLIGQN